jgi:hypothetical protein
VEGRRLWLAPGTKHVIGRTRTKDNSLEDGKLPEVDVDNKLLTVTRSVSWHQAKICVP